MPKIVDGNIVPDVDDTAYQDMLDSIPVWVNWDLSQGYDYIDTNVTNLATARVVLKEYWKAIYFLINKVFPNIRE